MTIVVEDGTGLANAESYISVANATTYLTARGVAESAWADLDAPVKEQLLRKATDYMEQRYAMRWRGYRKSDTQLLSWPRVYVERGEVAALISTSATWFIPDNQVPPLVANACAELALRANTVTLSPDLTPELSQYVIEKTVGPITKKFTPGAREVTLFRMIDDMLARFLKPAMSGLARQLVRS